MRGMIAALALGALAACDDATTESGVDGQAPSTSGYTMEVRASSAEQTYIVVAPDGTTVGARAAEGASALMDAGRAQSLFADPPPVGGDDMPEVFAMRLPGFSMSVAGSEDDGNGENGRVNLRMGGDGENIIVHADEGGPGDEDDRAYVRITGADQEAVREFIAEQEELSEDVKSQMRAALGL